MWCGLSLTLGGRLHYITYTKPALGGARPEAFVICEALIFTYANVKYALIIHITNGMLYLYSKKNMKTIVKQNLKKIILQIYC